MKQEHRHPFPLYGKLLLENKILLLLAGLLILLGAAMLLAQHLAAERVAAEVLGRDLLVEVDRQQLDRIALRTAVQASIYMIAPVLLVLLGARAVIRRAVQPLKRLTRAADEISTGKLDALRGFGVHVNCWEITGCQETTCGAYMNLDQQCWYIDGTPCEGYDSRFPDKLPACRQCEVYRAHRGDEIVQLADAFKHMIGVLKASREELVQVGDFQKRLIRNSFNGVIATDENDVVTIFNLAAEEMLGVDRSEVIGKKSWRAYFLDRFERTMDLPLSHERVRRVRGFRWVKSVARREDGEEIEVLLSGINLFERGIHIGKVFFFQDLREIEELREELLRSERLAATGQAAAGISHSIKNILDGFLGGAYVFKQGKRLGDAAKMDKGWDMVERNMEIISGLVRDLLNFAKDRTPVYEDVEPAAMIQDCLTAAGLGQEERIRVSVRTDNPPRRLRLDAGGFHQALVNLLRNAAEAIPDDRPGHVRVELRSDEERATLTVSDDGQGMSPETIDKIRGGMYSTKGSKGTGLGLLVIQKIVSEHRGELSIESEEGRGSTFRIEIPVVEEPAAA